MSPLFDFASIDGTTSGNHSHITFLCLLFRHFNHLLQLSRCKPIILDDMLGVCAEAPFVYVWCVWLANRSPLLTSACNEFAQLTLTSLIIQEECKNYAVDPIQSEMSQAIVEHYCRTQMWACLPRQVLPFLILYIFTRITL